MRWRGGRESCDVAVVGGGVLGLASAYELARAGARVVLLEAGRAGAKQSGRNLGFVRQQGRDPVELPMMMAANRRWRTLSSELGADVEWVMGGNLRLTNDAGLATRYERWVELAAGLGLDSRVVTDGEIATILGSRQRFLLGIFTASDGQADPVATCEAYLAAARAAGAKVVEGVAARSVVSAGGVVRGVESELGELVAPTVVLAAGAGSAALARGLGIALPQRLVRQTVVLSEPLPRVTEAACWTGELFIRQDVHGRLRMAASTRNEVVPGLGAWREAPSFLRSYLANRAQLKLKLDPASLARAAVRAVAAHGGDEQVPRAEAEDIAFILDAAERAFPQLPELSVMRAWAGEIDATPDSLPILDAPSSHPGLVLATGMSGHGFGVGPVVGEVVARLVAGAEPGIDLRPFRLARFSDGSRLEPARLL